MSTPGEHIFFEGQEITQETVSNEPGPSTQIVQIVKLEQAYQGVEETVEVTTRKTYDRKRQNTAPQGRTGVKKAKESVQSEQEVPSEGNEDLTPENQTVAKTKKTKLANTSDLKTVGPGVKGEGTVTIELPSSSTETVRGIVKGKVMVLPKAVVQGNQIILPKVAPKKRAAQIALEEALESPTKEIEQPPQPVAQNTVKMVKVTLPGNGKSEKCPECSLEFTEPTPFMDHVKMCLEDSLRMSSRIAKGLRNLKQDKTRGISCLDCGLNFFTTSSLLRHQKSECRNPKSKLLREPQEFKCDNCNHVFARMKTLKRHTLKKVCHKSVGCDYDHEHKFINDVYETLAEAKGAFFEKRMDGSFNIKGSYQEQTVHRNVLCNYECKGSLFFYRRNKKQERREMGRNCPAKFKIVRELQDGRTVFVVKGCIRHNHDFDPKIDSKLAVKDKEEICKLIMAGLVPRDIVKHMNETRRISDVGDFLKPICNHDVQNILRKHNLVAAKPKLPTDVQMKIIHAERSKERSVNAIKALMSQMDSADPSADKEWIKSTFSSVMDIIHKKAPGLVIPRFPGSKKNMEKQERERAKNVEIENQVHMTLTPQRHIYHVQHQPVVTAEENMVTETTVAVNYIQAEMDRDLYECVPQQ